MSAIGKQAKKQRWELKLGWGWGVGGGRGGGWGGWLKWGVYDMG